MISAADADAAAAATTTTNTTTTTTTSILWLYQTDRQPRLQSPDIHDICYCCIESIEVWTWSLLAQ